MMIMRMKNCRSLLLASLMMTGLALHAQVPQAISYQAVLREPLSGLPMASATGAVRFLLHGDSPSGPVLYAEDHTLSTNEQGLFALSIGTGSSTSGTFDPTAWSQLLFLETQVDIGNTGSFTTMGTQQLLSVPYALRAGSSSDVPRGTEVGQIAHWDGTTWVVDSGLYVHQRRFGIGDQQPEAPLAIKSREVLKTYFQTGDIPSQNDFAFTQDSTGFSVEQGTSTAHDSRLMIQSGTGNVGVNEKSPFATLHVTKPAADPTSPVALSENTGIAMFGPLEQHLIMDAQSIQSRILMAGATSMSGSSGKLHLQPLGGDLVIHDQDATGSSRVTITSNGNVGINETAPDTKFHVSRSLSDPDASSSLSPHSGLAVFGPMTSNIVLDHKGIQAREGVITAENVQGAVTELELQRLGGGLLIHGNSAQEDEKVIISSNGKIGVGVVIPHEKLEVNGRIIVGDATSSATPVNGTIRYNGTDFEGYTAGDWAIFNGSSWEKVDNSGRFTLTSPPEMLVGIGTDTASALLDVSLHTATGKPTQAAFVSLIDSYVSIPEDRHLIGLKIQTSGSASAAGFSKNIGLHVANVSGQAAAENNLAAVLNGNVVIGGLQSTSKEVGAGGTNVLAIQNGAAPSAPPVSSSGLPDAGVQLWSATDATGTSVLHLMNGDGTEIKLQRTSALTAPNMDPLGPGVDPSTAALIENMRTRINELETKLRSLGLITP